MGTRGFGRFTLSASVAAALLAACGGAAAPLSPAAAGVTAERSRPSATYGVLYSFRGGPGDGYRPVADLINVNGTLYGTTELGGDLGCNIQGCGTVFKITPSGTETTLHSFAGGSRDGSYPFAGLTNIGGTLYGTTFQGGTNSIGTVFKITTSGTESVLYSFGPYDSGDGSSPASVLLNVNGTLYGTTQGGGTYYCGTVFSITTSGAEKVLHSFKCAPDGDGPGAGLARVNGTLYGTTYYGGTNNIGSVFSITTSGTETVLYSFEGGSGDGEKPASALLNVKGTLYGTTQQGGSVGCKRFGSGCGTVFKITTSGTETVLHRFEAGSGEGALPVAGLVNVNGTLYGTTSRKGEKRYGTLFAITTSGRVTVLHNFSGSGGDGAEPQANLLNVNGTLYGTTYYGGAYGCCEGTVFQLSP